ncbi:MAG: peptide deformylase [Tissierellales bacterium]|nr:peptide deformylase [Tissierellales bacterium]MBN2827690.1 peptide deformylase [Tissierellales bacterium]
MAIRNLRIEGDAILRKKSKEINNIDERLLILLDDMLETMYANDGIGLAAVQVGVLKRAVVIDLGEGPMKLLNPVIVMQEGEQIFTEGCLSVPGKNGEVLRPLKVKVSYKDIDGNEQILEAENLMAVCLCHEIDHLNGVLFIDNIIEDDISE